MNSTFCFLLTLAQITPRKCKYVAELLFYCGRELLTNVLIAFAVSENTKPVYLVRVERSFSTSLSE